MRPSSGPVQCNYMYLQSNLFFKIHISLHLCCCCSGPHLQFEDEVTSLQPHVDKLRTLGVDKIIALGHSGFTMDKEIAKKVRGVDVVIGGHSNTFLYTGGR